MTSRTLLFITLLFVSIAGKTQTNQFTGYYSSNFGIIGMFMESIEFFPDSTFEYMFWGDMQHYKRMGHYEIKKNYIILTYYPKNDTSFYDRTDWVTSKISPPLIVPEIVKNGSYNIDSTSHRPTKFYYKIDRLYHIYNDGSIGSKEAYGTDGKLRKYFLIKRQSKTN